MARWGTSAGVTTGWVGGLLGGSVVYREGSPYFLPANLLPAIGDRKLLGRSVVYRECSLYFLPANLSTMQCEGELPICWYFLSLQIRQHNVSYLFTDGWRAARWHSDY